MLRTLKSQNGAPPGNGLGRVSLASVWAFTMSVYITHTAFLCNCSEDLEPSLNVPLYAYCVWDMMCVYCTVGVCCAATPRDQ